ncbi:MAG: hypothetical protein N3B17_02980 [Chlorobi bacterium]|nr:hypothetical protein [Chlorobiota bacterium]
MKVAIVVALLCVVPLAAQTHWLEGRGEEDPFARETEFWKQRAFPFDRIPDGAYERAIEHAERLARRKGVAVTLAAQPQWKLIGPDNIGGRTRTVVHHPTRSGVVYVGAAGGGIWLTTDHGATWEPLYDNGVSLSMGALAIDPNNPDVLYAGTGEITPASNMQDAWGTGMYKSTDGGRNWQRIGLSTVGAFSKVYVHPRNSNIVYAGGVRSAPGLYKSTDAGATWQRMNRFAISDIAIDPQNENVLWIGVWGNGVWKTTDGGATMVRTSDGMPPAEQIGRVSVQCAPSNTAILYALIEGPDPSGQSTSNNIGAIYKSTDGGTSWQRVYQGDASFFNGQGSYDNFVMVHPTNPNIAFAGGIDLWRTTNGGATWVNVTNSYGGGNVHPDQHAGIFNPLDPNEIYLANDGGMYRTTTGGGPDQWQAINNGYAVTQFYAMDIDRSADSKTYGGTQDNGTLGSVQQQTSWQFIWGGDGFYTVVHLFNPAVIYGETYYGNLWWRNVQTGQSGGFVTGIDQNDQGAWSSPLVLDRATGALYHGRGKLYKNYVGGSRWEAGSSDAFDSQAKISAIGPSPLDESLVYVGLENGRVFRTDNGGSDWTELTFNGLPLRFVRDIVCSSKDLGTAWICYSGYGTGHVFKTTDRGQSWQDISTTLPDAPVNALDVHPDNEDILVAGTDAGVFITFNGGQSWTPLGRGLPRAPVLDLQLFPERNVVRVATHGRSMWECSIPTETITEPEITSPLGGEVVVATAPMVFSWHGFTEPVKLEITYTDGQHWSTLATNAVGGFFRWVVENRPSERVRIRVTEVGNPLVSVTSNPFTILEFKRGSVQKTVSIAHVAYGLAYDGRGGLWTTSFYTPYLYKLDATTLQVLKAIKLPVGDTANCTDLTMDRQRGILYVHRLLSTSTGSGSRIVVLDTNGVVIRRAASPASSYGIGIELVGDKLVLNERDGSQRILVCNPETFAVEQTVPNPFREYFGPRCLAYDGTKYLYQVSTAFAPGGGGLQAAYLLRLDVADLSREADRMEILNSSGGTINARGVEFDPRDGNYWVTDLAGNIYKIANFETPSNPLSSAGLPDPASAAMLVAPNPVREHAAFRVFLGNRSDEPIAIEVFDALGRSVAIATDESHESDRIVTMDCSLLPAGAYSAVLRVGNSVATAARLIVVH